MMPTALGVGVTGGGAVDPSVAAVRRFRGVEGAAGVRLESDEPVAAAAAAEFFLFRDRGGGGMLESASVSADFPSAAALKRADRRDVIVSGAKTAAKQLSGRAGREAATLQSA